MSRRLFLLTMTVAACSGDNNVHHLGDAPPGVGTWQLTSALPVARTHAVASAPGNGFVYILDGYVDASACNSGTADGRVFFAKQGADGTLGAWTESTAGTGGFLRSIPDRADANGYIYVGGGAKDAPSWDGAVWFAKPGSDGNIATWTQATNAVAGPDVLGSAGVMAVDSANNLYAGAGFYLSGGAQNSMHLWRAALDAASGQPGTWTQLADLPSTATNGQLVFSADHAYLFDGGSGVYTAQLGASGPTGWHAAMALPITGYFPNAQLVGDRLIAIPGTMATGSPADVYASTIGSDGELGAWSVLNTLPVATAVGNQGLYANGFYYVLGDDDCLTPAQTAQAMTTYYCPM